MQIRYNVTGAERKTLVTAVSEILEAEIKYMGAPTFAYEVDYFTIDREGTLSFDDNADSEEVEQLIEALCERGFEAEAHAETQPDENGLTISLSRDCVSDAAIENLKRLVGNKAALIQKALGADTLEITLTDETISFPWFTTRIPEPDVIEAFGQLAARLLDMAEIQKRVNVSEKGDVENEKYAFRCFLLRLGFIGDEYKAVRKTLLKNLSGNGAFKGGAKKEAVNE